MIVYQDAEAAVLTYFATHLPNGPAAHTRIPNPRPTEFFRILRTGGTRETLITDAPIITVESWAATEAAAATNLNTARSLLFTAEGPIFGVREAGGPTNLPDPTTSQIRYTATFVVRVRATLTA